MDSASFAHTAWQSPATEQDLAQLYRAFLGREAEPGVLAAAEARPLGALASEMAASDEINQCVLHALIHHRPLPHGQLPEATLQSLAAWLADRLGCAPLGDAPATPAELLSRLYAQPAIAESLLLAHGSLFTQAMDDLALLRRAGRYRLQGKIEFVNREHISGWALDLLAGEDAPALQLHIRQKAPGTPEDSRLVATANAHSYRPDIHKLFGGSGLAGFRAKWEPRQFPHGQAIRFTLHEASTGAQIGSDYRFDNNFFDQLTVAQMLAHEFELIKARLDALAGMVPQALSYCAFPLEHYHYYRRAHRVAPPQWLVAWQEDERLRRRQAIALNQRAEEPSLPTGPHFTVLLDATLAHANATAVRISVDSLREQVGWPHWNLHVVGDGPEITDVAALLSAANPRIHHQANWPAAHTLVDDLTTRRTDAPPQWVILLQAGELLDEHALAWLVQACQDTPLARSLYWDEDRLEHRAGRAPGRSPEYADPILRTPFDPFSMLELNVVGKSFAAEAATLRAACALLECHPLPARQYNPLDAVERERLVWALHRQGGIEHLPCLLLTRTIEACAQDESDEAERLIATASPAALRPLLPDDWQHREWKRESDPVAPGLPKKLVRWVPQDPNALISVLIPTRDHWELVKQCVDSLYALAERPDRLEIIVADNGSTDVATLDYLTAQRNASRVRVIRVDEPFNWSRLNNHLARRAAANFLLFLNNDTKCLTRHWDSALRGLLELGDVVVSARLLFPDMTIQHAGVSTNFENLVGHSYAWQQVDDPRASLTSQLTKLVAAGTGAFLATSKRDFEASGCFNENDLSVTFNDVEWCLRLPSKIVYSPVLSLIHYESRSRGFDFIDPVKQRRASHEAMRLLNLAGHLIGQDRSASTQYSHWAHDNESLK